MQNTLLGKQLIETVKGKVAKEGKTNSGNFAEVGLQPLRAFERGVDAIHF